MDTTQLKYNTISILRTGIIADNDNPVPSFDIYVSAPVDSLPDDQIKIIEARVRELGRVKEMCCVTIHVCQPMTAQELGKVREFIHELERKLPLTDLEGR